MVHISEALGGLAEVLSGPRYEAVRKAPCYECKDDRYNRKGGCWHLALCSPEGCPFFRLKRWEDAFSDLRTDVVEQLDRTYDELPELDRPPYGQWVTILSKCDSPAEQILALELLAARDPWWEGWEPQFGVGPYRLDFALFLPGGLLVDVEVDGRWWHSSSEQIHHDQVRTIYLSRAGWIVARIPASWAIRCPGFGLEAIRAQVARQSRGVFS